MIKVFIFAACMFALASVLIWFAFLRPVPVQITIAVINAKTFKPAGTYWQQQVGSNRGFRTAIPISIAESYVLELHSEELGISGFFSISPSDSEQYHVNQKIVMEYQRHGLPLIGYKTTVLTVRPR
jgi:hypothetical protein